MPGRNVGCTLPLVIDYHLAKNLNETQRCKFSSIISKSGWMRWAKRECRMKNFIWVIFMVLVLSVVGSTIGCTPKEAMTAAEYIERGNVVFDKGKYDEAIREYSKAIELDPDNAVAWNNRGLAYLYKEQYDLAIADYVKAIELDPWSVMAYAGRGNAYFGQGYYDLAIAYYNKTIELDPEYAAAWNNRGLAYVKKGQYDLAIADYSKAIELDPGYAAAWNNKGVALQNLGRNEEALECYNMALQIDPGYELAKSNKDGLMAGGTQDNNTAGSVSGGTCAKTSCETGTCCHSVINGEVVGEAVGVYVPASCACPSDTVPTEYESVVAGVYYRYCECK